MEEEQLKKYQLFYDKSTKTLIDYNNEIASTVGKISKFKTDMQAFLMTKEGDLYIGTHYGVIMSKNNLSHASFIGGRPAEIAGLLVL